MGTINREVIMQRVVKQLATAPEITPEDIIANRRYQIVNGFEKPIENKLLLLNKRTRKANRVNLQFLHPRYKSF